MVKKDMINFRTTDHCYLINGDPDYYSDLDRMWYVNFASDKIKELREI